MSGNRRSLLIALCAGLAALALAAHFAHRNFAKDLSLSRSDRLAIDNGGIASEARGGATAKAGGGSRPWRGDAERAANARGDLPRRHPPVADLRRSLGARDDARNDTRIAGGSRDDPATQPDGSRADRDVLPAAPDLAAGAPAENESAPEPTDVAYDGADHVFDTQSRIEVPDLGAVTTSEGAMSFWVKPEWESGDPDHAELVQLGKQGPRVVKDGKNLRFEYTNVHGDNELGGVVDTTEWQPGEWRYVTATWKDGVFSLHVDGREMFVRAPDAPPQLESAPSLYIGSVPRSDGGLVPPAQLFRVVVKNRGLSDEEVQDLFESEPPAEPPEQ